MTEERAVATFETRLADRSRAYTNRAAARPIDALEIARTAMSAGSVRRWSVRLPGATLLGPQFAVLTWALAAAAVVVVGVVGSGVLRRPIESPSGPIADVLRHAWQRPLPVAPDPIWATAFLNLTADELGVGPESDAASRSAIAAVGLDTLVVTATAGTAGCASGDVGSYRWTLEGKGTFLTLTPVSPDACPSREKALTGPWVRADLPPGPEPDVLAPGTHVTLTFNPFGDLAGSGRLSFTVPGGWNVKEDAATVFTLHHLPDAEPSGSSTDTFVVLFTQPRMAAEFAGEAICGPGTDAPGIGSTVADLVAAIRTRPGVDSTTESVTIGGYAGQMLDLQLAASWTGGCRAPEGLIAGVPIVRLGGTSLGPLVGLTPNHPVRLYLLDLADGRTLAVAIFSPEAVERSRFDEQMADVTPIVESFEFQAQTP
jgi:hypothetical protein